MKTGADRGTGTAALLDLGDPRWEDFVARHPAAMPFHHPGWALMLAECYGFRGFAVASIDSTGAIRAGLPVVEVRHFGRAARWVSLPYTDHCPALAAAPAQEAELVAAVRSASRAAGIHRVEVRGALPGVPASRAALRHVLALDADPARVYAGFHRSQVQRSIRRAEREGLTVRTATLRHDLAGTFYRLHLRTRRRQGVPVQPRRLFGLLWDRVISRGLGRVVIVAADGHPVAAAVFLTWNRSVIYKFGASDVSAWPLRPNHLLFWHVIRTACEEGHRWFDFGRTGTGQEGLRNFKLSWGASEEPLIYGAIGSAAAPGPAAEGLATRMLRPVIRRGPLLLCRAAGEALYRYSA